MAEGQQQQQCMSMSLPLWRYTCHIQQNIAFILHTGSVEGQVYVSVAVCVCVCACTHRCYWLVRLLSMSVWQTTTIRTNKKMPMFCILNEREQQRIGCRTLCTHTHTQTHICIYIKKKNTTNAVNG